jgi:CRISPR-associated endonuclease Csn1
MSKKILGLDLGTNSIGWALVEKDDEFLNGKIIGAGTRIIPMDQETLGNFERGITVSATADRTRLRSIRKLRQRHLLRRERLLRVLHSIGFLPQHFDDSIDWKEKPGKYKDHREPKIAYRLTEVDGKPKYEFIYQSAFQEMLDEFKRTNPEYLKREDGSNTKIPYDWTIYYLRKKALTQKIAKEELAWIILNFNQKRGYYQLRGKDEEDENPNKKVEFHALKVLEVLKDEAGKKDEQWYSVILENGWIYRRSSKIPLFDWTGKVKEFIVTTDLNEDGSEKTDKDGKIKRTFRVPDENDWTLIKKKTEQDIVESKKTVGSYIYENLLYNPKGKIRGKLVRTIERKFYKEELTEILRVQTNFHEELRNTDNLKKSIEEIYKTNENQREILSTKDFVHLFVNDIIFYQRPLKTKKQTVGKCSLEKRIYKDKNGVKKIEAIRATPKSNPLFQEIRIWQWIFNLSLRKKEDDCLCTDLFIKTDEDKVLLFDFLASRKEIDEETLLKFLLELNGYKSKEIKNEWQKYKWNYVEGKKYPSGETRSALLNCFKKVTNLPDDFILTTDMEYKLWHIIYSIKDREEFEKALRAFANKNNLPVDDFVNAFKKIKPFDDGYAAFSEKAIKKLLPLMRLGKYWDYNLLDNISKDRIDKILSGEYDIHIPDRVRDKTKELTKIEDFRGLQLYLAQYIIYGRHSEVENAEQWESISDIDEFLKEFKQHELRNPIVENVVLETLRVVRDIWAHYGKGEPGFFNEIHLELAREMKNTKDEKERITKTITENENTNLRIKLLLAEMVNYKEVENVIPYSPMQQEILKIYEEGVLSSGIEITEDILKIIKMPQPSSSDLRKYKLWLEQKYRSPYTGEIIPLNKLFTPAYEIEHIIPQSRYFDDSFSNKVICEEPINKLKGSQLALEFIKNHEKEKIQFEGKEITVLTKEAYIEFVKKNYAQNKSKRNKLLMDEMPEAMANRQLNDTRYVSKFISAILSNIVREMENDDGVNSKNLLSTNGVITTTLKNDWGLNDVWNDLILPRFERMNAITNSTAFTSWNDKYQKYIPTVPIEFSKGFSKKRIDHRHHAMDAIVVACTTRSHINLLNNQAAESSKRYDLNRKLRHFGKVEIKDPKTGQKYLKDVPKDFIKPWPNFTQEVKGILENIIPSFKQNIRIINTATNKYTKWVYENGELKKKTVKQIGTNWAIRKPLHKDTVSGKVHLPWVKVPKDKIITATRKALDKTFDSEKIKSITDTGIQKILSRYLESKGGNPAIAFSPEGIEELNINIRKYNNGKYHQPIRKVRVFEIGNKFPLGETGNKTKKYVEAAKGTNLFFGVYANKEGKRSFKTIPLNIVIERLKQGLPPVPDTNDNGDTLLFHLSPNDLVVINDKNILKSALSTPNSEIKADIVYKMVSSTGSKCHFQPCYISSLIKTYDPETKIGELGSLNKQEVNLTGNIRLKENCQKVNVNRLGHINP